MMFIFAFKTGLKEESYFTWSSNGAPGIGYSGANRVRSET